MLKHFVRLLFLLGLIGLNSAVVFAFFNDSIVSSNRFSAASDYFVHPEDFIKINEVYPYAFADSKEQIELFNPTTVSVSLSNCSLLDGADHLIQISSFTIPANSYLVLYLPRSILNNSGDELRFICDNQVKDRVAWGNWDDGNLSDNAPNPGQEETIGRYPNGKDTGVDSSDFVKMTPNLGTSNHL